MDQGNTAFLLIAAALVLLMTPGLAFFYGGLVKAKSVISMMMMMSFGALGLIGVLWVLYGYAIAFSNADTGSFVGIDGLLGIDLGQIGLGDAYADAMDPAGAYPTLDFAGGTAVHINAGAAALALALVLGKRVGFAKGAHVPHNPPFVLLGAGLLWFGWFGFNAGSELAADGIAAIAFINTIAAPAAAVLGWLIVEKIKDGKPTSVGAASGAVAGLVAITPACASLTPGWAILLGIIAGVVCALAIDLKFKLGFDDSLDVVGIHLVGGLIGTLYIGLFATDLGLFTGGDATQLGKQAVVAFSVLTYSFVLSYAIGWIIQKTMGFRVKNEDEVAGIDTVVHGEAGYVLVDQR